MALVKGCLEPETNALEITDSKHQPLRQAQTRARRRRALIVSGWLFSRKKDDPPVMRKPGWVPPGFGPRLLLVVMHLPVTDGACGGTFSGNGIN